MTHEEKLKEFNILVNRAKRAGLKVDHYPEQNLVVIRVLEEKKPSAVTLTHSTAG